MASLSKDALELLAKMEEAGLSEKDLSSFLDVKIQQKAKAMRAQEIEEQIKELAHELAIIVHAVSDFDSNSSTMINTSMHMPSIQNIDPDSVISNAKNNQSSFAPSLQKKDTLPAVAIVSDEKSVPTMVRRIRKISTPSPMQSLQQNEGVLEVSAQAVSETDIVHSTKSPGAILFDSLFR